MQIITTPPNAMVGSIPLPIITQICVVGGYFSIP